MTIIDGDALVEPVDPDSPSGDDLEYDPDFLELERAAQGKPEQQFGSTVIPAEEPDWRNVQTLALGLLARTKDIRVVAHLARAMLHQSGLVGFGEGLGLLRRLLETQWATVHPQLDPEDDDDPTMRINALVAIQDSATVLRPLRETPLARAPGIGGVSLRDILIARGEMPAPADVEPMPQATIEAVFGGADADTLQTAAEAAREAAADLTGIEQFLGEQVGTHQAPDLSPLGRTLRDIDRTLAEQLRRRGLSDGAGEQPLPAVDAADGMEQGAAPVRPAGAQGFTGEIRNRADVLRALDQIVRYYEAQEPSSPVPLLLQRARKLVPMSFLEALTDLAPDGLPQIQVIGGIKPAEEEEA